MPDQNLCTFSDFLVVANMLNIAIIFFQLISAWRWWVTGMLYGIFLLLPQGDS